MISADPIASPVIRPPAAADRIAWNRLWAGYQAFYEVAIPTATTDRTWGRLLDPDEPVWAALAWRGDEAVDQVERWNTHCTSPTSATSTTCSSLRTGAAAAWGGSSSGTSTVRRSVPAADACTG